MIATAFPATAGTASNPAIDDATGEDDGQTQGLTTVPPSLDIDKVWVEPLNNEVVFHLKLVDLGDDTDPTITQHYRIWWDHSACAEDRARILVSMVGDLMWHQAAGCRSQFGPGTVTPVETGNGGTVDATFGAGPGADEIQVTIPRGESGIGDPEEFINGLTVETWQSQTAGLLTPYPDALGYADTATADGPVEI